MPPGSPSTPSGALKELLRRRQNAQRLASCDPCRERKVKCDRAQPCATCQKRGYPDLCQYHNSTDRGRASHQRPRRRVTEVRTVSSPTPAPATVGSQYNPASLAGVDSELPDSSGIVALAQGTNSRFLDSQHHRAAFKIGIMPLLGAGDQDGACDVGHIWKPTLEALLIERDALHVFQSYRSRVHPFHPIALDLNDLERKLCLLVSAKDASDGGQVPELALGTQWLCLLNAILACGTQASDLPFKRRMSLAKCHAKLAFEALQATDYLSQPYKEAIQALLLLGNVLQNEMRPQAAWSLAGTTIRLAQCLGIHQGRPGDKFPSVSAAEAANLRMAIVWQDALLSMAFGRLPASYDMDIEEDLTQRRQQSGGGGLTYRESMNWLCHLTLRHLEARKFDMSMSILLQFFSEMDSLDSSMAEHLINRQSCISIQQIQEYFAIELHRNFVISTICRQRISRENSANAPDASDRVGVLTRLKDALERGARAYLRLRSVTDWADRSWAFIHNGLTSVLLLSLMRETRHSATTKALQLQIIDSLESDNNNSQAESYLSTTHKKALEALKSLQRLAAQESSADDLPEANMTSPVATGADLSSSRLDPNEAMNQPWSGDMDEWLSSFDFNEDPMNTFDWIMTDPLAMP